MRHLEEGTIHAWLDGELPAAERATAEAHVTQCAACAAAVAEARGFIAGSSRILTALDAVPGRVMPARQAKAPARRFMVPRAWMAAAAVLVLGVATAIATRPRRDVAALRVAESTQESKPAAPPAAESVAQFTATSAAPARSAMPDKALRADKMESRAEREVADSKAALQPQAPAPAPAAFADTARPRTLALQQVVVTGAAVDAEPRLVSRDTAARGADTTVTTIYTVGGVRVTLIDRTSRAELQHSANSFSDAVREKASAQAPAENSITWSDSTGRTRTLRGALSQAELEQLKARLFGATP